MKQLKKDIELNLDHLILFQCIVKNEFVGSQKLCQLYYKTSVFKCFL